MFIKVFASDIQVALIVLRILKKTNYEKKLNHFPHADNCSGLFYACQG